MASKIRCFMEGKGETVALHRGRSQRVLITVKIFFEILTGFVV